MDISDQVILEASANDKSARIYYGSAASEASIADEECSVISSLSSSTHNTFWLFLSKRDIIEI